MHDMKEVFSYIALIKNVQFNMKSYIYINTDVWGFETIFALSNQLFNLNMPQLIFMAIFLQKIRNLLWILFSNVTMQIAAQWTSDVLGAPKPRNPRGTSPKVWSPNPTRPRKADPEPTPTSADPKFYLKNPRNPENPRGTSLKCWSPNPTRPRKADPEPDPTPTFAPRIHHY